MLARNETIFKWTLYAAATALCFLIQGALLQRITVWGVIPFLYPLLAAVPAAYEGPVPGTVFALAVGVICDLLLPGAFPCFYTLLFPLVGLCAALISRSLLPAGPLCSLAGTTAAFLMSGLFHGLLLWLGGKSAWSASASVTLREFCVTAPLVIPVTYLYRAVCRRTHLDD
ncbi:hypothetical protein [uncultured Dysosmobacter sp.]|uniref:hypothetical protein n=1 Tax=uncultured Dysosmobacter sp. TaxID=2591384 RepID=UPI002612C46F|nr:hypothetical protein [uncultured Dysosmobacter sp.]